MRTSYVSATGGTRKAITTFVIGALLAGGAVALTVLHNNRAKPPTSLGSSVPIVQPAPAPGDLAASQDSTLRRIAELEMKLAQLQAPATATAPLASAAVEKPPIDYEEARHNQLQQHAAALRAHEEEPVDPRWSRQARSDFAQDLAAGEKDLQFKVKDVDCRTTTCVATLTFDSYSAARRHWLGIMALPTKNNCTREVTLGDPSDPAAAFDTSFVFDCTEARAQ
jgi:hypothetical protein